MRSRGIRRLFLYRVLPVVVIVPLLLQILLASIIGKDPRLFPASLRRAKNLLIVTAHPDDECLFFAPSILGVLEDNPQTTGGLLVMSTGNANGIGEQRKKELQGSCDALSINAERCVALDNVKLQDNNKIWWEKEDIVPIVKQYVEKWKVDAIITFDSGGVSGHINHRAVSAAVSHYAATDSEAPATYVLTSVNLLRKYTFLGDLPLTSFPFSLRILETLFSRGNDLDQSHEDKALVASPWHTYLKTRQAFSSHDSQYSWDRNLYMILSRYVWFNDLQKVERKPA